MHIHSVDFRREQGRFITTGPGTDFNDNVLVIIRVFRKQQDLQFLLQLFNPPL